MIEAAKEALQKYFGYQNFRPLQEDIINSVFDQNDTLVLMPTGGGKSICYQIPGIVLPGTCIVVSPLISLMKDQVEGLQANGINAAFLNSTLSTPDQRMVEDELFNGRLDLLYVSPERLTSNGFLNHLSHVNINLFAIDEAHCISSWGHDFRPHYTTLSLIKEQFPQTPIIALTATADKLTRKDIVQLLNLQTPNEFIASFDRPNIHLEVAPGQKRKEQIINFIHERPNQSGIIYCLSRKNTEQLSASLNAAGITTDFYHAGLSPDIRAKVQEDFITDRTSIICATIAFGMGIDKSNVRWVIHYNMPKNIEGYYQEIGRAGRDGVKADALLFYSYGDVMTLQDIISKNDSQNLDVQMAKLDRMKEFSEALACRRRILLAYFNEDLQENCGNCDICENPPEVIDGTTIAQMALSAVYRIRQKGGTQIVIDLLRGSAKREIMERGFNQVKTYGAGRNYSFPQWRSYMSQLINLGYLEIAHDQKNVLQLTPASHRVLFEKEEVKLVNLTTIERHKDKKKAIKVVSKRQRARNELFEVLRKLRLEISREQGVPPYIVFSDKTLEEMAATPPTTEKQMLAINGVGQRKMQVYGESFLKAIIDYLDQQPNLFSGETYRKTYQLLQQGYTIEQISNEREIGISTVENHIIKLHLDGHDVDLMKYISDSELRLIRTNLSVIEDNKIKPLYDFFDGTISYFKLKVALTLLQPKIGT